MIAARSVAIVLTAWLPGQAIVTPAHFEVAEADRSSYSAVAAISLPARSLGVHDDLAGRPMLIQRLAFRPDRGSGFVIRDNAPVGIDCELDLSTAAVTSASLGLDFDAQHGSNRVNVMARRTVQLPRVVSWRAPAEFAYELPLDRPFGFDGSGSLCWDLKMHGRTNGNLNTLDAGSVAATSPTPVFRGFGQGCRVSGQPFPIALSGTAIEAWSLGFLTWTVDVGNLAPNGLCWLNFGLSDSNLGAVPLPFELPGTRGQPSGACTVYNDIVVAAPRRADPSGSLSMTLMPPLHASFHGQTLFVQALQIDPTAGVFGVVTSNGGLLNHAAPWSSLPIRNLHVDRGLGPLGSIDRLRAIVVRLD